MPYTDPGTDPGTDPVGAILEIDPGAVVANWRHLCRVHRGAVGAVLKADAYGLGARAIAPALHAAGCRHFFVAHLGEAQAIASLVPGAMVAVLNGLLAGQEAAYVAAGLVPVLGTHEEVARWATAARAAGRTLPALLHVDTGMARLGFDAAGLAALLAGPGALDGIALRYVMTHLVSAEIADDPLNAAQARAFAAAAALLPGVARSLANSSGIFLGPDFASDLARPGAALYGINPTPGAANPMRQAVRLLVRVLQVRDLPAGAAVGYNATWRAARASRIAVACAGYADGLPRSLSGRAEACFDGRRLPLVGRVSMDLTTFDATDCPGLAAGDWLELIGPNHPPDALAREAGTNGYEILTSLGRRYHRRII